MNAGLAFEDLEQTYDLVAEAIDAVGPRNEAVFLAKLCLTLAHRLGDLEQVREAVALAAGGLSGCEAP